MLARVVGATVTILGSGSAGNCALLETPQVCLLIDAGLSGKQIALRLASIGRTLDDVDAVLLTHEHHDHTQGLPVLCRRYRIPVFASRPTVEDLQEKDMAHVPMEGLWKVFQTGQTSRIRREKNAVFAISELHGSGEQHGQQPVGDADGDGDVQRDESDQ